MSVHMKARRTNSVEVTIGTRNPKLFVIPKDKAESLAHLLEEYEATHVGETEIISPDRVFRDLNEKYTRPGSVLRGARLKEELSQVELAKKLGISQADLSKMEHGTRTIGKAMARRLAQILKVNYRVFL